MTNRSETSQHPLFPSRFFITGTDTDVGKTIISAILTKGLDAFYWKPIQSGLEEETDTEIVKRLSGLSDNHFLPETYRLKAPLSPHASSRLENTRIDLDRFRLPEIKSKTPLIVEGAGGILVPLNETDLMIDLMKKLTIPVLIVSRSTLGTINHTLLSIRILRENGLDILGVVMNGPKNTSNREAIEHYGNVRVIAEIDTMENLNETTLAAVFKEHF